MNPSKGSPPAAKASAAAAGVANSTASTSLKIFHTFLSTNPADGSIDASRIHSRACYEQWLRSRDVQESDELAKKFYRTLSNHVSGVDGRSPFTPDEEAAILEILRVKQRWPCFPAHLRFGTAGFRSKGFTEKKLLALHAPAAAANNRSSAAAGAALSPHLSLPPLPPSMAAAVAAGSTSSNTHGGRAVRSTRQSSAAAAAAAAARCQAVKDTPETEEDDDDDDDDPAEEEEGGAAPASSSAGAVLGEEDRYELGLRPDDLAYVQGVLASFPDFQSTCQSTGLNIWRATGDVAKYIILGRTPACSVELGGVTKQQYAWTLCSNYAAARATRLRPTAEAKTPSQQRPRFVLVWDGLAAGYEDRFVAQNDVSVAYFGQLAGRASTQSTVADEHVMRIIRAGLWVVHNSGLEFSLPGLRMRCGDGTVRAFSTSLWLDPNSFHLVVMSGTLDDATTTTTLSE